MMPYLPLEIREHILRFTGDNFIVVLKGILGGKDIHNNFILLLDKLTSKIKLCKKRGTIKSEYRLPNGMFHHSKHPSYVKIKNNILVSEKWNILGIPFKKNESAIKYFHKENGRIHEEYFYNNDIHHCREDKIKQISYYENGTSIYMEMYFKNNLFHREDGQPSVTEYYKNGVIKRETWYLFGKVQIGTRNKTYYENGKIKKDVKFDYEDAAEMNHLLRCF